MDGHYIGLMSGPSMDAVAAALVEFRGGTVALTAHHSQPLTATLRESLLSAAHDAATPLSRMTELDVRLGRLFAQAALSALRDSGVSPLHIRAIGSHGQTIYHAVFHCPTEDRVVINIGGIANITALPREPTAPVRGFDSGPGNVLMDYWIHRHQGAAYDRDGAWAASGRAHPDLLTALLSDGYFARPPPKSTGREYFNPAWLDQILRHYASGLAPADVQATLCDLTVASLARAIDEHAAPGMRVLVCGGGAHNVYLMTRLRARLMPRVVHSTEPFGVAPQWVESMAFAWLARQTLMQLPGNLPAVTGARHSVILGAVYAGASRTERRK